MKVLSNYSTSHLTHSVQAEVYVQMNSTNRPQLMN